MDRIGAYTVSQVVNKIKDKKGGTKGTVPLNSEETFILSKLKKHNGNTKIATVLRMTRFRGKSVTNHTDLVKSLKRVLKIESPKKKKTVKKKTVTKIKPVNKTLHTIKENVAYY